MNEFEIIGTVIGIVWFALIGLWGVTSGRGRRGASSPLAVP